MVHPCSSNPADSGESLNHDRTISSNIVLKNAICSEASALLPMHPTSEPLASLLSGDKLGTCSWQRNMDVN